MKKLRISRGITAGVAGLALASMAALTSCAAADPLGDGDGSDSEETSSQTLVVGSQDYYSNEIIAELYAQALETRGYTVDRQLRIGQREVYMPEIEAGEIDVFLEYTGNLLQYLAPDTTATTSDDVFQELAKSMPAGMRVLDESSATDQDSYVVTREFAEEHNLKEIGDLASVDSLTLGGNSELETRPYGPEGLLSVYGVTVAFTPIEDSGGPLTVKALRDNQVQMVDLYSADPVFSEGDLVTLADPKGLFLASHVVPVVSDRVDDDAVKILNAVSAALTPEALVQLNAQSVNDESPAAKIAAQWLKDNESLIFTA